MSEVPVEVHMRVSGSRETMNTEITIDGRKMTLAEWMASVESRLIARGMTLADLDRRREEATA